MPKIAAVILNYNSHKDVENCVNSLLRYSNEINEIIIVDNNSRKESLNYILNNIKNVQIVKRRLNDGYAAGNNEGIKTAISNGADYILIMNPDIIISENILRPLIETLSADSSIGIVTGKAYLKSTSKIYTTGGKINFALCSVVPLATNQIHKPQFVKFISGCLMLIRKEVILDIGYLDEKYFMYCEDLKFSYEVNKKFKLYYQPESVFYHGSGAGNKLEEYSPMYLYYSTRNRILFFTSVNSKLKVYFYLISFILILSKFVLLIFRSSKTNSNLSIQISALVNGWIDGLKNVSGKNINYI
ncbi:MAG: glycosyltransferase family 2 protein [Bacteroidetes bacterium]|nr:glycosyltransferase family 2 protein [Bacteroidota bacterium]